jgi:wobble nucleotide-excising tRNase
MLERFESVKKIGLFEDYTHSPDRDFGEVTLIYGENGVGKSTLAAILDSLRERNAGEIIRRRSLPGDVAPTAAVRMNGTVYTFDGSDWDNQLPYDTLEVFFPGFVTRNVHAATEVDPDQRRNLCELVLGRMAVEKVRKLARADSDGREALAEIKAIEKDLQLLIKKPDNLQTFLGLPNDKEIEENIERVRTELKQAQSRDAILARAVPKPVGLPDANRSAIAGLLEMSADDLGADVTAIVRKHIDQHLDNDGENWLGYGAKHIGADNECPFCAQDITGSGLVAAIRSYFSEEYRAYTELLGLEMQAIRGQLGAAAFPPLQAALSAQIAVAVQWAEDLPIDQLAVAATLVDAETAWESAAEKLEGVLTNKQARPLERMGPELCGEAMADYERAISLLKQVNGILSEGGQKAEQRKAALLKADTTEIEQRLNRLENQKARFEPLAQDLLRRRNAQIEKRSNLEKEKAGLKAEIDKHAERVVGKYQAGINHYLEHFGCDMRIESVEPAFPSGRASVQYILKVHGYKIELGLSATEPCFETVLSEGDKNLFALSFFFARLKDQCDLTRRVVVLDDPVNSLGSSRRLLIEGVIRDLHTRGAQVVVLTHDERLAAMIWRDRKLKHIVPLQVARTKKCSQLQPWDVERATRSEYVKHYLALSDYIDNGGDHESAAACIRPYVEQRLRHLFPGPPFETRDTLGNMIAKIRDSRAGTRLYPLQKKLTELESINAASLPSHHATDDVPGIVPLTPAGVRLFAVKALEVLE